MTAIEVIEAAKKEGQTWLRCADFSKVVGFPGCCFSCHDDWDDGYDEPFERTHGETEIRTCCKVGLWLDKVIEGVQ